MTGPRNDDRHRRMLDFERGLWATGVVRIAGVDEAGVGPLAGPVVAAAVILPTEYQLPGLDDSKKIASEKKRDQLALRIQSEAVAWALGTASVEEIDALNIYQASLLAMRRAVEGLAPQPEHLLVDARRVPGTLLPQQGIVRGDSLSLSIAAASILAKTSRDRTMQELALLHPGYGLEKHKGYPTADHVAALQRLGATPIHRRSFAPVRAVLDSRRATPTSSKPISKDAL